MVGRAGFEPATSWTQTKNLSCCSEPFRAAIAKLDNRPTIWLTVGTGYKNDGTLEGNDNLVS